MHRESRRWAGNSKLGSQTGVSVFKRGHIILGDRSSELGYPNWEINVDGVRRLNEMAALSSNLRQSSVQDEKDHTFGHGKHNCANEDPRKEPQ